MKKTILVERLKAFFPEEVRQTNKFMNILENNTYANFCWPAQRFLTFWDIFLPFFLSFHMFSQKNVPFVIIDLLDLCNLSQMCRSQENLHIT